MIRRTVLSLVLATSMCLPLWVKIAGATDKPDASLQFNGGSAAAGVGVSWGAGVLQYKGRAYPFKVSGLSVGAVGLSQASASGEVHNLKSLDDFNGNYTAVGAGLTAAGGGGVAAMKNQNGVEITVKATTRGAKVVIGGAGVDVQILK
jgi:hypothetical protein